MEGANKVTTAMNEVSYFWNYCVIGDNIFIWIPLLYDWVLAWKMRNVKIISLIIKELAASVMEIIIDV